LCKNIAVGVDTYFAIKRFSKLTLRKHKQYVRRPDGNGMQVYTQLDAVRKEIDIMKHINHPSCIKLYEVIEDVPEKDDQGNDLSDDNNSEKIYLIMELAKYKEVMSWNTSTYKFEANPVFKSAFIPEAYIRKIVFDCVQGLSYLHNEAKIVHRDIKPQNILLCPSQEGITAKLCDFGVSEKFSESDTMMKTAGTYHFFPPECCDPDVEENSGKLADVWALGITLYCMIFNQLPFWDYDN
jgi:serine/threonine protein kinase